MNSTTTMTRRLEGLLGTTDLNEWEQGFVRTAVKMLNDGRITKLTERQIEILERLRDKHFAS